MARTIDPCAGLRKRLAAAEARLAELQELLPETPPLQRPALREEIKREQGILARLTALLRACEREHTGGSRPGSTRPRRPVKHR